MLALGLKRPDSEPAAEVARVHNGEMMHKYNTLYPNAAVRASASLA